MKIKSRPVLFRIVFLIAFVLSLTACGQSKQGGGPPGGTPEVAVVTLQPERVPIITELPGRVSAHLIAEVRPQVGGIIQKRFFTEGSDVKAGDILYQIDPATYEASYSAAKASLARAEANVISIRNRVERYKELVAINAVSQQENDDVTKQGDVSRSVASRGGTARKKKRKAKAAKKAKKPAKKAKKVVKKAKKPAKKKAPAPAPEPMAPIMPPVM